MSNGKHDLQPWGRSGSPDTLAEGIPKYQARCRARGVGIEDDVTEIDGPGWWSCRESENSNELSED
jgi:hypothetical protein